MHPDTGWSPGQRALLRFLEQQGVLSGEPAAPERGRPTNADLFAAFAAAIDQEALVALVADALRIAPIDLGDFEPEPDVLALVPAEVARRGEIVPVARRDGTLEVAVANPLDIEAVKSVEFTTGLRVRTRVARRADLCRALGAAYGVEPDPAAAGVADPIESADATEDAAAVAPADAIETTAEAEPAPAESNEGAPVEVDESAAAEVDEGAAAEVEALATVWEAPAQAGDADPVAAPAPDSEAPDAAAPEASDWAFELGEDEPSAEEVEALAWEIADAPAPEQAAASEQEVAPEPAQGTMPEAALGEDDAAGDGVASAASVADQVAPVTPAPEPVDEPAAPEPAEALAPAAADVAALGLIDDVRLDEAHETRAAVPAQPLPERAPAPGRPAVLVVSRDLARRVAIREALEGAGGPCIVTMRDAEEARAVLAVAGEGIAAVVADACAIAADGDRLWDVLAAWTDRIVVWGPEPPAQAVVAVDADAAPALVAARVRAIIEEKRNA